MDEKLQERLAYLERQADELSDEVARQAKLVDRLARQVGLLIEREATREAEGSGGVVIGDERPPHY
ncbi:SlyX protein [Alphaproteobacteria bacterium GH1-50]|uniref:SlyX protein n=1 Tax=Kangsaoukella pontilimi TaxID=2691042 RepID=A0A7C9IIA5_9RHOB|nr:SlyX family protein [Kangsaoukella pontilimi]MXQ09628.1 SlyX protein [Kangsaoukella pontilimi]